MATKKKSGPKKGAESKNSEKTPAKKGGKKIETAGKTTDELSQELEQAKKKPGTVTIKKIKYDKKKNALSVDISIIEKDGSTTIESKTSSRPVHPDFQAALSSLRIHWAILNDYVRATGAFNIHADHDELVESIHISSVTIGGNDGEEGIMITGQKKTRRKKSLNINTAFERFEEVEDTRYRFMDDLEEKWNTIVHETELYLSGEKVGQPAQPELGFSAPGEEGEGEEGEDLEITDDENQE